MLYLVPGFGSKTYLGSNNVIEQNFNFCVFKILTFSFDLIFGSFLTFLGPGGLFWGSSTV